MVHLHLIELKSTKKLHKYKSNIESVIYIIRFSKIRFEINIDTKKTSHKLSRTL